MASIAQTLLGPQGDGPLRRALTRVSPEEQALLDMSPVDAFRMSQELGNKRTVPPEQASANRQQNLRDLMSIVPGPGNVIAAEDAVTQGREAAGAFGEGRYGRAALLGGMSALSAFGAATGLPTGRMAGNVARGAKDVAPAFPAWHGSPHDFDEFKLDKIGTGEGAQAYGHGLYFAENPEVAKSYRDALAFKNQRQAAPQPTDPNNPFMGAPILEQDPTRPGRLYKAEIDAEPHQLLDWDQRFEAQSPHVQSALKQLPQARAMLEQEQLVSGIRQRMDEIRNQRMTPELAAEGEALARRHLAETRKLEDLDNRFHDFRSLTATPEAVAALRAAGIPGIRYLDQGSRDAGEGSRNFVIFDDKLTKILSKE